MLEQHSSDDYPTPSTKRKEGDTDLPDLTSTSKKVCTKLIKHEKVEKAKTDLAEDWNPVPCVLCFKLFFYSRFFFQYFEFYAFFLLVFWVFKKFQYLIIWIYLWLKNYYCLNHYHPNTYPIYIYIYIYIYNSSVFYF